MCLIILILIATVPSAYALNHAVSTTETPSFVAASQAVVATLDRYVSPETNIANPRDEIAAYVRTRKYQPSTSLALRQMVNEIAIELSGYRGLAGVPAERVRNFRNDMYLVGESLRLMRRANQPALADAERTAIDAYRKQIDGATKFIPWWVKVAVALALGLGTMVGWKRIVITVG